VHGASHLACCGIPNSLVDFPARDEDETGFKKEQEVCDKLEGTQGVLYIERWSLDIFHSPKGIHLLARGSSFAATLG
jgi:hypothetical protein